MVNQIDNSLLLLKNLHTIGNLYQTLEEHHKTIDVATQLKNESLRVKNDNRLMVSLILLGNAYISLKEFDKSESSLYEALLIAEKMSSPYIGVVYFYLAELEFSKSNYEKALSFWLNKGKPTS